MSAESFSANPFDPTQPTPPFAGRESLIARVHQHLTGAPVTQALLIIGRRRSGRTALIHALRARLDDTFVWVELSLTAPVLTSETAFWHMLWEAGKQAAAERGLSVHRLPHWPDDKRAVDQRAWLVERGLPELYQLIRPHRRLVLVADNAEPLADAVTRRALPADFGEALGLMFGPQLGMMMTAHLDAEPAMKTLAPLVDPDFTIRLNALTPDGVAQLLAFGRDGVHPDLSAELYRLTGGAPELTLRAAALAHEQSRGESYRPDHLRAALPDLMLWAKPSFNRLWENLTTDEQAVLTALAYLHFQSPDKPIQAEQIESWLTDTEYPLDLTTIFSLLRRLEFVEIVDHTHRDVKIHAGLFEQWIRETIRPNQLRLTVPPATQPSTNPKLIRYGLMGLGLLLLILVLAIALGTPAPQSADPLATVVLDE